MSTPQRHPPADTDFEYRTIEATLLETARGRWFLSEFGRRSRRVDNALLEDAIARLKSSLREPSTLVRQLAAEIETVRQTVLDARASLLARTPATAAGDATAAPPEQGMVQHLLRLAEDVHALTWTLQGREGRDFDAATCEQIARQTAAMYALSFQQSRITESKLETVNRLDAAERRLAALLDLIAHEAAAQVG